MGNPAYIQVSGRDFGLPIRHQLTTMNLGVDTMRASIFFIVSILLLSALPSTADAQLFDRLKDRAKQAAERKAEEKLSNEVEKAAERAVEKSWNSIFGDGFGSASGTSDGESGFNMPFSINSNAETEDAYTFQVVTTMLLEVENRGGDKEQPVEMQMHFNEDNLYSGTKISGAQMEGQDEDVFLVYDMKNQSMVMMMESEDGKFSFAYDWKQAQDIGKMYAELEESENEYNDENTESEIEDTEWPDLERIGTKTIAGIECQGYRMQDDTETTELWMTEDEEYGIQHILQINSATKAVKGKTLPDNYPTGMLMEMIQENHNSDEKTTMTITEINKNANVTYSMADYPAMSFGGKR
jgi:hypothetical protein